MSGIAAALAEYEVILRLRPVAPSSVACLYDDSAGYTRFSSDFEKTDEGPELVETS